MNKEKNVPTKQTNSEEQSEFNEAVKQIQRIGDLWILSHFHKRRGNLGQWNVILDCVWMELSDDMEDEKNIININKDYLKYKNKKDFAYQVLLKKEKILRLEQKRQGKSGKKRENLRGL